MDQKMDQELVRMAKREYYHRNKERIRIQKREYYHRNKTHLLKSKKEYQKKYKEANRAKIRENSKKYYQLNKERIRLQKLGVRHRNKLHTSPTNMPNQLQVPLGRYPLPMRSMPSSVGPLGPIVSIPQILHTMPHALGLANTFGYQRIPTFRDPRILRSEPLGIQDLLGLLGSPQPSESPYCPTTRPPLP